MRPADSSIADHIRGRVEDILEYVDKLRKVGVTELVLRDAHQSLMATRMATDSLAIKDMAALLKPQPAYHLVSAIKAEIPGIQVKRPLSLDDGGHPGLAPEGH